MNHRLTALISVLALVGMALAFMDSRHASAMDVHNLSEMILADRIHRLEYQISEEEDEIVDILSIDVEDQTRQDLRDLNRARDRKEELLRRLERLVKDGK
ncbi:MAG TPA: hypothetical protein VMW50_12900 [Dehalococcoidia bacterium]|nr:hypothetical protein [Dehalococcoidia bacterium]